MSFFHALLTTGGVFSKKANLLVFITPAQSNAGSVDDATSQPTGRVPYANMPVRLQTAPSNVDFVKQVGATLSVAPMEVLNTNEWGWLNQFIHVIAPLWDEIIYCKKSLGGATILPGGLGTYPRVNFIQRADTAIPEANSRWGEGNYNILCIGEIGESNALNASDANAWFPAHTEWIDDTLRDAYTDFPFIAIKKGKYQAFAFPYIVSNLWAAQDAYIASDTDMNFIVEGEGALWELKDQANDFSHYNAAGAISMGNIVAEKVIEIFNIEKSDSTKPTIVSAVIENAAPRNIVITTSKPLDTQLLGFWKDWTVTINGVLSTRMVNSISISGSTITASFSEPFYATQTIQVSYTKGQYYESSIADPYGNQLDSFSLLAVTNNVLTAVPTYTTVYTSNFSVNEDGWSGASGGVPVRLASWDGRNNVLECGSSDATPIILHTSLFANTTNLHIVDFDIWVPSTLATATAAYTIIITTAIGGLFASNLYTYTRANVLGDQWLHIQVSGIPSTAGSMRFEGAYTASGGKFYLQNIVVKRVN